MTTGDSVSHFFHSLGDSIASAVKILIMSKWITKAPIAASSEEIVILGNGPSLNHTLETSTNFLRTRNLMAVNFAANTPIFADLKPEYYILADPLFFKKTTQQNILQLWDALIHSTDWNLTLFIPVHIDISKDLLDEIHSNAHINVCRYNTTPIEGFKWLEYMAFSSGLGMPRPRNVLIPAIMTALRMKYRNIYIAGADHSWTRTLSVTDDNRVVSIQPHFYEDDEAEQKRVHMEYMQYPLHKIMHSFYIAFKSYFTIERYAKYLGCSIWNITPDSFIDAFQRKKI